MENPLAAKVLETEEGQICAELIRDFLEFYKMDYTLQIFLPECNLPAESKMKSRLAPQLNLISDPASKPTMPLLAQLIQQHIKNPSLKSDRQFASPLSPPSEDKGMKLIEAAKDDASPSPTKVMVPAVATYILRLISE